MAADTNSPDAGCDLRGPQSLARWFALRTKSNFERVSAVSLSQKGYETFLPTWRDRRRRRDRAVDIEVPLFPSYVFCRFDFHRRLPILLSPGIIHIVGGGAGPEPVADSEIEALRAIADAQLRTEPWPFLQVGQRVRIAVGPLAGIEGLLIKFKSGHRLVVSVMLLQRSVAAEIDGSWVYPAAQCSPGAFKSPIFDAAA